MAQQTFNDVRGLEDIVPSSFSITQIKEMDDFYLRECTTITDSKREYEFIKITIPLAKRSYSSLRQTVDELNNKVREGLIEGKARVTDVRKANAEMTKTWGSSDDEEGETPAKRKKTEPKQPEKPPSPPSSQA